MQTNLAKKIEKVFSALNNIDKFPRKIIKYGSHAFLMLFATGTAMVVYNRTVLGYDPYFEFVSMSLVKTSFTILAEAVIGGLLIDFIFNKK
ncbi:MAG: hypothetical protein ACOX7R_11775 [Acetivibrionales bacterium]